MSLTQLFVDQIIYNKEIRCISCGLMNEKRYTVDNLNNYDPFDINLCQVLLKL